jgi:hypothetical protein
MLISKAGSSIWTTGVCYASATLWTWFVINLRLRVCKWILELFVKCNVWCVMLNDAILVVNKLVWNPSWFRLTTRIIWAQVRKFECFGACFCTCALIIWSVLLQLASSMSCSIFQRRPRTHYMCAQEVHTYNNRIEISKQCLYKAENILY